MESAVGQLLSLGGDETLCSGGVAWSHVLNVLEGTLAMFNASPASQTLAVAHQDEIEDLQITAALSLTPQCGDALTQLHLAAFAWQAKLSEEPQDDEEDEEEEDDELHDLAEAEMERGLKLFNNYHSLLQQLGLQHVLVEPVLEDTLPRYISQYVEQKCKDVFDEPCLVSLLEWIEVQLTQWFDRFGRVCHATMLNVMAPRLAHRILGMKRISELFDIIVDFPDSEPALQDLRTCLKKMPLRQQLITQLKQTLQKRLLHPGAQTNDIITQYTNAVSALRMVDPSGVILDIVCEPVRAYLQKRNDTVRCIVEELLDPQRAPQAASAQVVVENAAETDMTMDWIPDPLEASKSSLSRQSDMLTLLVSIYGSKELLVTMYRSMMAERMLALTSYNVESEMRTMEQFKVSFGEEHLTKAIIMLKDMATSRRIQTNFDKKVEERQSSSGAPPPLTFGENFTPETVRVFVISRLFWPNTKIKELQFALPEELKSYLAAYTEEYEKLTQTRSLEFRPNLGNVQLEVELEDRTLEVSVSPLAATLLWKFDNQSSWTLSDLSEAVEAGEQPVRRALLEWCMHGVLTESQKNTFVLVERASEVQHGVFEEESAEAAIDEELEERMKAVWMFVNGMLQNNPRLSIDRIYSLLNMFMVGDNAFKGTQEELKRYLDMQVRAGALATEAGEYKLPTST
eukprot:m.101069 g.101069  ORF g.101069 m.101069 type:complete len:684 (+) comp13191_c0_seq1:121-2172(+)